VNPESRLKIAVFIDFDNIEIGVKSTLGGQFDIGPVLDALKERGEVVSKTAYSDWKRAGDHSRMLSQHAIKMVQRTPTPGGDKNGADINLALDALEMAFTHPHINAYVIVGGDSDFISLVEKLKQYDKTVLIVGGRSFTSAILQRNCHEFIAYENLVGANGRRGRDRGREEAPGVRAAQAPLEQAVPLVRRALKVLADREVSPQLGLLKSTLLQLDSTFSERSYGASTFRDFAERLAATGLVTLKVTGRNIHVELKDDQTAVEGDSADRAEPVAPRHAEGVEAVRRIFTGARTPPRFPMFVRNVKQFLRTGDPSFDERQYGFGGLMDLLRACQREGLFRLERDRRGALRVSPGPGLATEPPPRSLAVAPDDFQSALVTAAVAETGDPGAPAAEPSADEDDAALRRAAETAQTEAVADVQGVAKRRRRTAAPRARKTGAPRISRADARARARRTVE
jgi:uncharacterized LabA/DUF88 family protein